MEQTREWIDLKERASVEITSEDPEHPIERAFECHAGGWRAGTTGEQRIRLRFDSAMPVRRIQLRFVEPSVERTQEFELHWCDVTGLRRLVVRQQWNFSPTGSTTETEDYRVELDAAAEIELTIRPGADSVRASLDCWRMG